MVRTEDGVVQFEPSLAFNATHTQFGRNQSCRFSVADGRLQVTVTHDWMKNPEKPTESRTVTLPWNPESRTFDVGPLKNLVSG